MMSKLKQFSVVAWMAAQWTGCSNTLPESGRNTSAPTTTAEIQLCQANTTYASPVTVNGTATFYKRGLSLTISSGVVTNAKLAGPISTPLPIKFAEVRVLDSAGNVIQCGTTNATGAFKALDGTSALTISNVAGTYTIEVLSRANHSMAVAGGKAAFNFLASIKKDLYSNEIYRISASVNSNGSGVVTASPIAYARESESADILGGAFNIYNDILTAYEYLASATGTSSLVCMNPKLDVYWRAGFNPAQYLYPSADPNNLGTVSFYVRGNNQLFINGGVLGNVAAKDTDHFDDTVIIHELGHHVEDVCGKMDSPGGTHYGLYRIDPRFAWSEGWGNFFGAHVFHNNITKLNPDLTTQLTAGGATWDHYVDTAGYTDGSVTTGASLIVLNLTKPGNNPESVSTAQGTRYYDKVNPGLNPGEGHAREVSISRSLYKNTNSGTDYFSEYWKAFENDPAGIGMGKSQYPFRNSARFYNRLNAAFSGSMPAAIDTVLNSDEAQQRNGSSDYVPSGSLVWPPYAIKLVNSGGPSACSTPLQLQPRSGTATAINDNGMSDQRFSNHYFLIDMSVLPGVTQITLSATKSAGTNVDIDLILFKEGFKFNEDCAVDGSGNCTTYAKETASTDMVRQDRSVAGSPSLPYTKTIQTLDQLSSSAYYLLDVRAYTGNQTIAVGTVYNYTLTTQTGAQLCPSATY